MCKLPLSYSKTEQLLCSCTKIFWCDLVRYELMTSYGIREERNNKSDTDTIVLTLLQGFVFTARMSSTTTTFVGGQMLHERKNAYFQGRNSHIYQVSGHRCMLRHRPLMCTARTESYREIENDYDHARWKREICFARVPYTDRMMYCTKFQYNEAAPTRAQGVSFKATTSCR